MADTPLSSFVDTFPSAALDPRWTVTVGAPVITAGQLHLPCTSGYTAVTGTGTGAGLIYRLTGSFVQVEVPQTPAAGAGTTQTYLMVASEFGAGKDCVQLMVNGGNLRAERVTNNAAAVLIAQVTYNATNHRWWRIRESGGTIYFEASPDGKTWPTAVANVAVTTTNLNPSLVTLELGCGYYGAETTPADAVFDNVNAGVLSTKTGTAAPRGSAAGAKLATHQSVKTGLAARGTAASGVKIRERAGKTGTAARGTAASGAKVRQATNLLPDAARLTLVLPPIDFARRLPTLPVLTLTPTLPPLSTVAKRVTLSTLTLPLTIRSGYTGGRSLGTLRLTLTLPPPTVGYLGTRAAAGIPPVIFRSGIRAMAQTIIGGVWVHRELPVDGLRLSYRLSGANSITGSIGPEHAELGELLAALPPWGTWLHVEQGGMIVASGILMPVSVEEDGTMALTAVGPSAYAARIPYVGEFVGIQVDPIDIVRHLWTHVQSFPRGDLGLEVLGASGVLVGYPAEPAAAGATGTGSADKIRAARDIAIRMRSGSAITTGWVWDGCPAWVTANASSLNSDYSRTTRGSPSDWLFGYASGAGALQAADKVFAAKAILARFDAGQQITAGWTWDGAPAYVGTNNAELLREYGGGSPTNTVAVKNWMDGWIVGAGDPPGAPDPPQNPYYIHGYELPAIGDLINRLGTDTPFDYVEEHGWADPEVKNTVFHRIRCQAPQIGQRLDGLNFTQGENVFEHGAFEEDDAGYADSAYVKGAGTGPDSIVGYAGITVEDRLRMPTVVTDQRIVSKDSAVARAAEEVAARLAVIEELSQIAVNVRHENSPWGSFSVGDEILPRVRLPYFGSFSQWHRVVEINYDPDAGVAVLTLTRRSGFGK